MLRLGAILITPYEIPWHEQRSIFRDGGFDTAKVHIPPGFMTDPDHVRDLISDGARAIILRTEDAHNSAEQIEHDLYGRGFVDLIREYQGVEWWIQVGNEPEWYHTSITPDQYRQELIDIYDDLHDHPGLIRAGWIAGVPVTTRFYDALMFDSAIINRYDALGCNLYGHWNIGDTGSEKKDNFDRAVATGHPIWITESGIHGDLPDHEKAERIMRFYENLRSHPINRRQFGLILYAIGATIKHPHLDITPSLVRTMGHEPQSCRHYPETGYEICGEFLEYFDRYGGVRIFGYPITGTLSEYGRLVQYFERARFEWHPENPPDWRVLQGHLGWEIYRTRYGQE